jgi:hypothetical protein
VARGVRVAQDSARRNNFESVTLPVICALIGAGATFVAPTLSSSASPSTPASSPGPTTSISTTGGVVVQGIDSNSRFAQCITYEQGLVVPLARINYKIAETLLNSHSPINRLCGLLP